MTSRIFGTLTTGETVEAFTLTSPAGVSVEVITYGGIITSLLVPDRQGELADVVLGFDNLEDYLAGHPYFGAIVGRIAGRLSGGKLTIGDRTHQLVCNDSPNHLHGGVTGLDKRIWAAQTVLRPDSADSVRLTYRSPEGEEGYPGNLDLAVTYTLTGQNELIIETEASTDRATPVSLTNHSYFNLSGEGTGSVANHELQIVADAIVPSADEFMTLSGQRQLVAGTPNDFRQARRLGEAMSKLFKEHGENYLLRSAAATIPSLAARVVDPHSGRVLSLSTNDTCLQFYTGVALDGKLIGKSGRAYQSHDALCLECQGYPDGVSHPEFGDILVHPGQPQRRTTVYAFTNS